MDEKRKAAEGAESRKQKPAPFPQKIGKQDLARAAELLTKYRQGKTNLESRIVEDELWWELRHWEAVGRGGRSAGGSAGAVSPLGQVHARPEGPRPTSAWLFNAILNKHADAMDNYPEAVVLPREPSDEAGARTLSSVLPVVMEYNDFEKTYSDNWWEKLKHGTAAYGVFWNSEKENGLGDIDIVGIDLLRIFWEPGVTDLQKSRNLFIVELTDREALEAKYPEYRGRLDTGTKDLREYLYDDTVDTSDKAVVVDWYYKVRSPGGAPRLHYVKYCGDCLLYASENDPAYAERGFYDHGLYPVVLDVLFPEKGTPAGFGYVAVCKNPQIYIDAISANVLENALMNTKKRFFVSSSTGINEGEFLDLSRPMVHVEGELDERRLQEIVSQPLSSVYLNVMQMKIDELKDTAANRDVNAGSVSGGVTAAAAIAALQEAGSKVSRDMISASYRAHTEISRLCIELMRQFYDEGRAFRVTGRQGDYRFVDFSNAPLRDQPQGEGADGTPLIRRPVFDLKVRAQKSSPFSRMEQNSRAQELYSLGFFNPDRAEESLSALEMMDFEGIDRVRDQLRQGQTLNRVCGELTEQLRRAEELLTATAGGAVPMRAEQEPAPVPAPLPAGNPVPAGEALPAPLRAGYVQRLAEATP